MDEIIRMLVAALALAIASPVHSQARFPEKPVKIIVGFPPGTSTDTLTRLVAVRMSEGLGQPLVVENKPGAGSSIGAETVARSAPDGYTLLASSSANTINPSLYKLSFDLQHDLAPIGLIAEAPLLLIVHPSAGVQTVQQLIAMARGKPGALVYGSSGIGTFVHLNGELFKMNSGANLGHIPYKGSSQAIADLLSGQIQVLFTPASTAIPHVRAGKALALGVIGRQRSSALPDVPTLAEAGVPGLEASLWSGLHAPAGTPPAIIERLNHELQRVLALPDIKAQLAAQSNDPLPGTSTQFARIIRDDTEKWARVVKTAGIKSE
jgi:tripartite-type tricarboxylate transporter receptor subunit TctC